MADLSKESAGICVERIHPGNPVPLAIQSRETEGVTVGTFLVAIIAEWLIAYDIQLELISGPIGSHSELAIGRISLRGS